MTHMIHSGLSMSYQDIYETLQIASINKSALQERKLESKKYLSDWEHVRYGEPTGTVKFNEVKADRMKLIRHYFARGYEGWPREIDPAFRKHVATFRCHLDFWEQFSTSKVFCKDEIYIRCLQEGPAFAEYIKKCRATCLRGKTMETNTEIEEEYFHDSYTGYNSIIHERYLIHWDASDEVDDIKYAFIPTKQVNKQKFRRYVRDLFNDFKIRDIDPWNEMDMLSELKNTKMYDPINDKTELMRSFWKEGIDTNTSYFAKRTIVPIEPGNIRDTGIGDPATILKVKRLNSLARLISERLPYCANAPAKVANNRLLRVLKRNAFLHLDFKKFGLTFPRELMNIVIEEAGAYVGLETEDLLIKNFTVQIGTECFDTERGTMLGWLDGINCLAVCAILHHLIKGGMEFDFVTFNDDVEISTYAKDVKGKLELIRAAVLGALGAFDILISINKTYGSLASVFLERYCYFDRHYGLDMYKEQLTVKAYAQSCVTKFPWKAKMYFAAAEQWTKSTYATDRCRSTLPVEFDQREFNESLWSGGWFIKMKDNLDMSLVDAHNDYMTLGSKLGRWRTPNYTQEVYEAPSQSKIQLTVENKVGRANNASEAREMLRMRETFDDINIEDFNVEDTVLVYSQSYSGRDSDLPDRVLRLLEEIRGPRDWGP
jgi:hypothetical protein